jgi:hypothetical protein
MPPCLYLRDWYESGKSLYSDQAYRLPYLPTLVSPFHAEPSQPGQALFQPPLSELLVTLSMSSSSPVKPHPLGSGNRPSRTLPL